MSDTLCLEDNSISIAESPILKNDNFSKTIFHIELDSTTLPNHGKAEIVRNAPSMLPTFYENLYYDTVTIKYTYLRSDFKLDSVRYIIKDFTKNNAIDSAWVFFDVGCKTKEEPELIICDEDKIVSTDPNQCTYSYTVPEPVYVEMPIRKNSFNLQIGEKILLEIGSHNRISVFAALFTSNTADVCETYVEVIDTEKPLITCPNNISSCDSVVDFSSAVAMDNCSDVVVSQLEGLPSGSIFPKGTNKIVFEARDNENNTSTCEFNIEVSRLSEIGWINAPQKDTICSLDLPIDFKDSLLQSDLIGFWSDNTQNGILNPSALPANTNQVINYTANDGSCTYEISREVFIIETPVVDITPLPENICVHYPEIDLSTYQNSTILGSWYLDDNELTNSLTPKDHILGEHVISFKISESACGKDYNQNLNISNPEEIFIMQYETCNEKEILLPVQRPFDLVTNISFGLEYQLDNMMLTLTSNSFGTKEIEAVTLNNFTCNIKTVYRASFYEKPSSNFTGEDVNLAFDETNFNLETNFSSTGHGQWIYNEEIVWLADNKSPTTSGTLLKEYVTPIVWQVSNGNCQPTHDTLWIHKNKLAFPNAFSPNFDGKNDFFELNGIPQDSKISLEILNRWGQVVYTDDDYKNDWEGVNQKGEKLPNDVYFYCVRIENKEAIKGKITLRR